MSVWSAATRRRFRKVGSLHIVIVLLYTYLIKASSPFLPFQNPIDQALSSAWVQDVALAKDITVPEVIVLIRMSRPALRPQSCFSSSATLFS